MFKVRVIPCLDVKDGRVVKGVKFLTLRDAGDPVEAAMAYDAAGADELTFLDITASHENRGIILDVVRRTAEACFMPLRSEEHTSELQSRSDLVCRLLLEKKKTKLVLIYVQLKHILQFSHQQSSHVEVLD